MRYIPTAFKIIINIFFYSVYTIISMLFGGWLYGLILTNKGLTIPENGDSIYFKIAIIIAIIVLLLTFFFRKYFYISVLMNNKDTPEKKVKVTAKKIIKEEPIIVKKAERIILNEDEIEILLDKEIK